MENALGKAVLFDLDGTLYITNPSAIEGFIEVARSMNITVPEAVAHRLKLWAHHYWSQHEQIRRDMLSMGDDFWIAYSKLLLKAVGATQNLEKNARHVRDWFNREYAPHVSLPQGARETLLALKEKNYILGLVSNRTQPLGKAVSELGLDGIFDFMLAAGEVGCWKPNPAIFNHALAPFRQLTPQQCWYVGDNYYADGHGAAAAGLRPVIFDPDELYSEETYPRIRHIHELLNLVSA